MVKIAIKRARQMALLPYVKYWQVLWYKV
jgi:ribosomal protein S18